MDLVDSEVQERVEVGPNADEITTPALPERFRAEDESSDDDDEIDLDNDDIEEDEVDLDAEDEDEPAGDDTARAHENLDPADNSEASASANPEAQAPNSTVHKPRTPTCPLDLPISVVRRIMKSAAPNRRLTPDLITAFARCAGVYGLYLLSACQEASVDTNRTTIRPIEVINGLIACGFPELAEETRISMGITITSKKKKKMGKRRN